MGSKLHELLAVEASLEKTARKLSSETVRTLEKDNLFKGSYRRLEMFDDKLSHLETEDTNELDTTVDENLKYLLNEVGKYWNLVLQKERTNQTAVSDIVMDDGTVLVANIPATYLLGLEAKLGKLREVYDRIPTLAPGIKWVPSETDRKGVFVNANDTITFKTQRDLDIIVAYDATEHHPAQLKELETTKDVGRYITTTKSGMLSPAVKAERISRLDEVLRAVKKARMRANSVNSVEMENVSSKIFDFINGDK